MLKEGSLLRSHKNQIITLTCFQFPFPWKIQFRNGLRYIFSEMYYPLFSPHFSSIFAIQGETEHKESWRNAFKTFFSALAIGRQENDNKG